MSRRVRFIFLCLIGLLVAAANPCAFAADSSNEAAAVGMVALDDDQLASVNAGEFSLSDFAVKFQGFDVSIHDNEAGDFSLDIAQSAFNGAQGVFTTLQTVNSAVDLTVIVNIFLNTTGQSQG